MIRLALLVLAAYLVALPLWSAAIQPQPNPWVQVAFVADLVIGVAAFAALLRRLFGEVE